MKFTLSWLKEHLETDASLEVIVETLTRIAARRSPAELVEGRQPMSRAEFAAVRQRLRDIDAA